ncbi:unnamed protein product [Sphagnum troendelagicum]|uniref:Uncharacterized protein n=1 Tax=Sphagnum troendelagicum TaxID=128251 RepID=A0ABP0UDD3_9BRYO
MEVGWKYDECRTDVGRKSDGSRTEIGRKFDGRRTSRAQPQLLRWQVASLHYNSWQRNVAARPAKRCNSLLWRGQQNVVARCYGKGSRALQLVVAAMASSVATRGARPATLHQRAAALANAAL